MKWFVYVIWARDEEGNEVRYYGHTKDMKDREDKHVNSYNAWVRAGRPDKVRANVSGSCSSVFVIDMGGWSMDVLHELDCDEEEASRVEGNYIRYNKCVNRCVAGRTRQQHYQDNREHFKQKYQANKAAISSKNAKKVSCPCGALVGPNNMSNHLKTKKHKNAMTAFTS
jgi:hypothetical protein